MELGEEHIGAAVSEDDVEPVVDELGINAVAVAIAVGERFMVASW